MFAEAVEPVVAEEEMPREPKPAPDAATAVSAEVQDDSTDQVFVPSGTPVQTGHAVSSASE